MKNKLTLSIDKEIIRRSKLWAKERGDSLSEIIEDFLEDMLGKGTYSDFDAWKSDIQLNVEVDPDFDWKKERENYLIEKYGESHH